jgi:hypothetical protein
LCDPPYCFFTLKDVSQWPIGYDPNCVRQEVVLQLPSHHENCVEQLLHLRVLCLSILEDFADKVHMFLLDLYRGFRPFNDDDCANHGVGGCHI